LDGGGGTELRCDTLLNERGLPEKSGGSLPKIFEQSSLPGAQAEYPKGLKPPDWATRRGILGQLCYIIP